MGFALVWILIWGYVFDIINHPSAGEIIGFIIIGVLPPIVTFIKRYS